jgi:hypothetical protein
MLIGSLKGILQHEQDPFVTEYGPRTYILILASLLLVAVMMVRLVA